jgi:drug/metabolite transporter (DMT)-like permease
VKRDNFWHLIFRVVNWLVYIYLTILSGQVAVDAQINPGIINGVLSTSIIFSSVFSYLLFDEKVTLKMMLGITIVIISVTWISLVNGNASG